MTLLLPPLPEAGQQTPRTATPEERIAQLEAAQQQLAERLRVAEAAMRHSARLAIVGQLTAAVLHEVNNPIAVLLNALQLLDGLRANDPRHAEVSAIVRREAAQIAAVVGRTRDVCRADAEERSDFDLRPLLDDLLKLAGLRVRTTRVALAFVCPQRPIVLHAHAVQLRQLFLNLIMNAMEAMPDGGTLTVHVTPRDDVVTVDVQDTGGGIAPELRSRLFAPFVTSKPAGTGLGLFISKQIVGEHGGRIEVESTPRGGSVFRVSLPYGPAQQQWARPAPSPVDGAPHCCG